MAELYDRKKKFRKLFIFGGQNNDLATYPEIAPRVGLFRDRGLPSKNHFFSLLRKEQKKIQKLILIAKRCNVTGKL